MVLGSDHRAMSVYLKNNTKKCLIPWLSMVIPEKKHNLI
jgi:hypothetical protein